MSSLVAMQDRVDPAKVESMRETPSDKPPLVVRMGGRNYVADGHHRAAAAYMNGDKSIDCRFCNLTPVDSAVKSDDSAVELPVDTQAAIAAAAEQIRDFYAEHGRPSDFGKENPNHDEQGRFASGGAGGGGG